MRFSLNNNNKNYEFLDEKKEKDKNEKTSNWKNKIYLPLKNKHFDHLIFQQKIDTLKEIFQTHHFQNISIILGDLKFGKLKEVKPNDN